MKKLTYYLLAGSLVFFCFTVKAQNFALGVRGGMSIPNLTAGSGNQNPLNTGYSSILGPDAGLFAEFKFSGLFSLQPMIEYSTQGGKKNGLQAFTTPDAMAAMFPPGQAPQYLYANYNSQAKMNYLLIPVLAKFGWNFSKTSPWRVYVDAGPFAGFLLSAHQVTSGESQFYTDPAGTQPLQGGPQSFNATTDIKSQLHTFNFGIEGNVGFSYKLGKGNLFIEGGGNYGFLNIQKFAADGKNETGAGTVVIGYSYWFGK
ncbi:MAG: porin family protein [Sphingobacteriales bacterium]